MRSEKDERRRKRKSSSRLAPFSLSSHPPSHSTFPSASSHLRAHCYPHLSPSLLCISLFRASFAQRSFSHELLLSSSPSPPPRLRPARDDTSFDNSLDVPPLGNTTASLLSYVLSCNRERDRLLGVTPRPPLSPPHLLLFLSSLGKLLVFYLQRPSAQISQQDALDVFAYPPSPLLQRHGARSIQASSQVDAYPRRPPSAPARPSVQLVPSATISELLLPYTACGESLTASVRSFRR